MQYSIVSAISTILFASSLTSAVAIPRQAQEINLTFKTGDGDAAAGETIAVGSLQTKSTLGQTFSGVNVAVTDAGFTCQAFKDAKGTQKIGTEFSSKVTASFSDSSDGSTASKLSDAVTLGSICCDKDATFKATCSKPVAGNNGNQGSNNAGTGAAAGASTTTTSTTASATATATAGSQINADVFPVTIQLSGLSELAVQFDILSNGKPQPARGAVGIQTAAINHTHKQVKCVAFSDAAGKKPIGSKGGAAVFSVGQDATLSQAGVDVAAIACKVVA